MGANLFKLPDGGLSKVVTTETVVVQGAGEEIKLTQEEKLVLQLKIQCT